jgi:LytS/YehU family sensor histidine kinase
MWRVVLLLFAGLAIEKMSMTKIVQQSVVRSISRKREQIATLREELEDLSDYLDLVEARVRDEGKPRLTHDAVKKRYGLK